MVPVEVGVAEEGGMDGGAVGLHSAFRNHCAHSFPARLLLPFVMSSVNAELYGGSKEEAAFCSSK